MSSTVRWTEEQILARLDSLSSEREGDALRAYHWLQPLGRWLLPRALLERAIKEAVERGGRARRPELLPEQAAVLVAWTGARFQGLVERGLLRGAFVLPVQWKRDEHHDVRLPRALIAEADRVCRRFEGTSSRWGLQSGIAADLSGLEMEAKSAWAILAASLQLVRCGLRCRIGVTATACFDEADGLSGVEKRTIRSKLVAAQEAGLDLVFVADVDREETRASARELKIKAGELRDDRDGNGARRLRQILTPLLRELSQEPEASAPLEQRKAHFGFISEGSQIRSNPRAREYYKQALLADLLERCARRSREALKGIARGGTLITFLTLDPLGALFAAHAVQPRRIYCFHTAESYDAASGRGGEAQELLQRCTQHLEMVSVNQQYSVLPENLPEPLVLDILSWRNDVLLRVLRLLNGRRFEVVHLKHDGERTPDTEELCHEASLCIAVQEQGHR
ncbi:MAG: hypothetical protein JNM84_06925 [Planctomycetes bacterium]|nr:hypothetical protein [Planctomycetota bacterium]